MSMTVSIAPSGDFSLELAAGFGFGPNVEPRFDGVMRLAFVVDGLEQQVGAVVRQSADGSVSADVEGSPRPKVDAVRRQVARILSLDHSGEEWRQVGARDEVVGVLQDRYRGLRPVLFHSPYEAAAWAIISARLGRRQATRVRQVISERWGATFELAGKRLSAFPVPTALAEVDEAPGLSATKAARLRALADRAQAGDLDVDRLVAMGPEAALAAMQTLDGIGPFYASLIVVRACGLTDVLATGEPRLGACVAHYYRLGSPPSDAQFEALAEPWRPFRTWACVLLRYAGTREGLVAP
jgi:DNA-3-methyladenine glycosylase II